MELKNKFTLSKAEAVSLLNNLANSLQETGQFQFGYKEQEISVDVGPILAVDLIFSTDYLSVVFNWDHKKEKEEEEEKTADWRSKFDTDMKKAGLPIQEDVKEEGVEEEQVFHPPPLMVPEVKLKEELEAEQEEVVVEIEEEPMAEVTVMTRKLPKRILLNTTTLPYDGGVWWPSFTLLENSSWTEILIDSELENTRWAAAEHITTLSDITPTAAKPVEPRSSQATDEEDLFSDLDDLEQKPRPKKSRKRKGAKPASLTIEEDEDIVNWSEPAPEDNVTGDNWVKPSEVLKTKAKDRGVASIPKPGDTMAKSSKLKEKESTLSSAVNKIEDDIKDWKDPSEQAVSDQDDWVRPSELHQKKGKKTSSIPAPKKRAKDKKSRPPPEAPDKKKKGWAEW
ncbi:MAG: hypothetical protein ACXAD7_08430 [Candidatus Kariarchaeaceae archaeon]|jgi:hypothetical protein